MNLFIFGVGFSGLDIAKAAQASGAMVAGTTRNVGKASRLTDAGIEMLMFDGDVLSNEIRQRLRVVTHLIISVAPGSSGDPVLKLLGPDISSAMPMLKWIGYLSTVGVYGDHSGAWVDEETVCRPVSQRSVERLSAEEAWRGLSSQIGVPLAVLRLSGIYGPGRNAFVNLADGSAKRIIKPGQFFNRIHVRDIAGAAMHLGRMQTAGLFNVTDDEPAAPQDVVAFAAELAQMPPPPEIAYDDAQMSEMARSFYGEVKRVSNAKLRAAGYAFAFPNYRAAFEHMWRSGDWKDG